MLMSNFLDCVTPRFVTLKANEEEVVSAYRRWCLRDAYRPMRDWQVIFIARFTRLASVNAKAGG